MNEYKGFFYTDATEGVVKVIFPGGHKILTKEDPKKTIDKIIKLFGDAKRNYTQV